MENWQDQTPKEWVQSFVHSLGLIPTAWYLDAELHQRTYHWRNLQEDFIRTFGLIGGSDVLDEALQDIDVHVFGESISFGAIGGTNLGYVDAIHC